MIFGSNCRAGGAPAAEAALGTVVEGADEAEEEEEDDDDADADADPSCPPTEPWCCN